MFKTLVGCLISGRIHYPYIYIYIFFFYGHYNRPIYGSLLSQSLGGGFKCFLFSSLFGEMIPFDEHMFQAGLFNHQLGSQGFTRKLVNG